MSTTGEANEGYQPEADGQGNLDQELARKVALQKQMLEHERQKEALGYQQSLLLQQQQMAQPIPPPPPPPQMTPPVPPPAPQPIPPQQLQVTSQPQQQADLMLKALQQQQMLEAEKQREAQQKLLQQQQFALLEAQRSEQQKRMMMEAQQHQQSVPSQTQPGGPPSHMHPSISSGPPQPPPAQAMVAPPQTHPGMPVIHPPQVPPPMHMAPPHGQVPPPMSQPQQGGPGQMQSVMSAGHMPLPPSQGLPQPPQSQPQGQPPHLMFAPPGQGPPGAPTSHLGIVPPRPPMSQPSMPQTHMSQLHMPQPHMSQPPMSQPPMSHPSAMTPIMVQGQDRGFREAGPPMDRGLVPGGPGGLERGPEMDSRGRDTMDQDMRRGSGDQDLRRGDAGDQDMRRGPIDQDMRRGSQDQDMRRGSVDHGPERGSMNMDHSSPDVDQRRGGTGSTGDEQGPDRSQLGRPSVGRGGPPPPPPPPPPSQQGSKEQGQQNMEPKPPQQQPGPPGSREIRLPQALEKVLEFKSVRAQEMGMDSEDTEDVGSGRKSPNEEDEEDSPEEEEGMVEEDSEKTGSSKSIKESKNKKRKKKKKAKKSRSEQRKQAQKNKESEKKTEEEVIIEYVQEQLELDPSDPNYHSFAKIFEAFKITEAEKPKDKLEEKREAEKLAEKAPAKSGTLSEDANSDDDMEENVQNVEDANKISKKKLKKLTRLSVAQLKQLVTRPDVVEMHDVTAKDPRLLVHLKATRNTVPVPRHWCYKRKYLQGKRGIEKAPFELPEFIRATGIEDMRAALQEKEEQKNLKAKMREKVRPKLGKIDIDYQKLHDAFFRFQTKPKMTIHGDLYYESKEFETRLKEKKPGNLTDDLRVALGMPIGALAERVPPPWLIAMQRYGPPPSYPNLKIPGLNAPIPEGCSFGYHAGGWGKPPVDENGKPLYGDVFGTHGTDLQEAAEEEELDKSHWGELESESESEEESEEEEDEKDESGLVTPAEGLVTPSGLTSIPVGVETPDMIELRKRRIEDAMDQGGDTPALYTVLPEKKTAVGGAMMGSAHIYDISAVQTGRKGTEKGGTAEGVEVTLNPEELDLDTAAMQAKYDETMREQQSQLEKEDLSDMVAVHAAKQRKRKKQQADSSKSAKRYKDFKF